MAAEADHNLTPEQAEVVASLGRATGEWGLAFQAVLESGVDVREAFRLIGLELPRPVAYMLERMAGRLEFAEADEAPEEAPPVLAFPPLP